MDPSEISSRLRVIFDLKEEESVESFIFFDASTPEQQKKIKSAITIANKRNTNQVKPRFLHNNQIFIDFKNITEEWMTTLQEEYRSASSGDAAVPVDDTALNTLIEGVIQCDNIVKSIDQSTGYQSMTQQFRYLLTLLANIKETIGRTSPQEAKPSATLLSMKEVDQLTEIVRETNRHLQTISNQTFNPLMNMITDLTQLSEDLKTNTGGTG